MKTKPIILRRKCSVCNKCTCYEEGKHEDWLEEKVESLYGEKCKDYEASCPCCQAWDVFDTIIKDNRGKL